MCFRIPSADVSAITKTVNSKNGRMKPSTLKTNPNHIILQINHQGLHFQSNITFTKYLLRMFRRKFLFRASASNANDTLTLSFTRLASRSKLFKEF